jgi:hypothetical protein
MSQPLTGRCGRSAVMLLLVAAAGCGPREGRVTGRVLFDGTPLPGGTLTFMTADLRGQSYGADVDESGNYSVVLPAGDVLVSFDNRRYAPLARRGPPPLPPGLPADIRGKLRPSSPPPAEPPPADVPAGTRSGRYVKVPERYHMVETSDLKFAVKPGEQQHDIELTSKP